MEIALNAQQFTFSCLHYSFVQWTPLEVEPQSCAIGGGTDLRITGEGFVASPLTRVRITRADTGDALEVEAALGPSVLPSLGVASVPGVPAADAASPSLFPLSSCTIETYLARATLGSRPRRRTHDACFV